MHCLFVRCNGYDKLNSHFLNFPLIKPYAYLCQVVVYKFKQLNPLAQKQKAFVTFCVVWALELPIVLLKLLFRPETSLFIIFVGNSTQSLLPANYHNILISYNVICSHSTSHISVACVGAYHLLAILDNLRAALH